jgi:hypothetical protein
VGGRITYSSFIPLIVDVTRKTKDAAAEVEAFELKSRTYCAHGV